MTLKPKSLFLSTTALALLALPGAAQESALPDFGTTADAFAGDELPARLQEFDEPLAAPPHRAGRA